MTTFLLTLYGGICLSLIGWGMLKPGRLCEFPFLAGATFAGFVLPQAMGVTWSEAHAPAGLDPALVMCLLCAVMSYLGYAISDRPMSALHWEFNINRLLIVSAGLSVLGIGAFLMIRRLPAELVETGGWHGLPVAYFFFAQVLRYGFALAFLLYIAFRSRWALAIVLIDCVILFDTIVIRARRGFAIEFVLVILCTFWFVRRKTLPRWALPILLVTGLLGVTGTAAYRATMFQDQAYGGALRHDIPWEEILKVDFVDVFVKYNQEQSYEFRNLIHLMGVTDNFDGGLSYWNEAVFVYVPGAQVVGAEFKEGLKFDLPGEVTDPLSPGGTTITGMGDSFQAFGWLGCLVFFVIAFVMRKLFETAQAGQLAAQLLYMLIITSTLHTITHHTKWFLTGWIHMSAFVLPCLWWARVPVAGHLSSTFNHSVLRS